MRCLHVFFIYIMRRMIILLLLQLVGILCTDNAQKTNQNHIHDEKWSTENIHHMHLNNSIIDAV